MGMHTHAPRSRTPVAASAASINHSLERSLGRSLVFALALFLGLAPTPALAAEPSYTQANAETGVDAVIGSDPGYLFRRLYSGACVGDFNADTWPDLFIACMGDKPDVLYINQQDGTFVDMASPYGVAVAHLGGGAAAGDVNNDGYMDLYVVSQGDPGLSEAGRNKLYINNGPNHEGHFSFSEIATGAGVNHTIDGAGGETPAFGDIDLDGDLDLIVATWLYAPNGNRVFENQFMETGTVTFVDITDEVLEPYQRGVDWVRGFTPHIVDITGDRYPEILLTADFRTSQLYVNNGLDENGRASFRNVTEKAQIIYDYNGMGAAVADFNGDQLLDWFMTNIHTGAGIGNTLYMNTGTDALGDPLFLNQAAPRGVDNCEWGWGVLADDFDHDTDQDLIAVGGFPGWPLDEIAFWRNDGTGFFSEDQADIGLDIVTDARGIVSMDYDKDLDLDIVVANFNTAVTFYKNDMDLSGGTANVVRVRLDTTTHPCMAPHGLGAEIRATAAGTTQLHPVHNKASYLGQAELITHIGLGSATQIDTLEVTWNDGTTTTLTGVAANQEIVVNAYAAADMNQDGAVSFPDVGAFLGAFTAQDGAADFSGDGAVSFPDVGAFLGAFTSPCP